jgi:hypothetical protein
MSKQPKTTHSAHSTAGSLTSRPTCRAPEYRTKSLYDTKNRPFLRLKGGLYKHFGIALAVGLAACGKPTAPGNGSPAPGNSASTLETNAFRATAELAADLGTVARTYRASVGHWPVSAPDLRSLEPSQVKAATRKEFSQLIARIPWEKLDGASFEQAKDGSLRITMPSLGVGAGPAVLEVRATEER